MTSPLTATVKGFITLAPRTLNNYEEQPVFQKFSPFRRVPLWILVSANFTEQKRQTVMAVAKTKGAIRMLRMSKYGNALTIQKDECLFTARDIFALLSNIDELNGHKIRLRENLDGSIQIQVGASVYTIWDETEIDLKEQTN